MKLLGVRGGSFFTAALFLVLLGMSLFAGLLSGEGRLGVVDFPATYYFLVRDCSSATAGAVAGESYGSGGAGYLLEEQNAVVLACYYTEEDATFVEGTMSANGVQTRVLAMRCERFYPKGGSRVSEEIAARAGVVDSHSRLLFDAANGLERGTLSQEEARAAVRGVEQSLGGLIDRGGELFSAWNVSLLRARRRARELSEGLLFSKDLRYLQVELCMSVLNMRDWFA